MKPFERQDSYQIRCEWGIEGMNYLSPYCEVCIIVDVLSFTTSVDIAVNQGARIYPYRWQDESIRDFAKRIGVDIADKDHPRQFSLKPSTLTDLPPETELILASPNGATLSTLSKSPVTIAGSLRNAKAVGAYARKRGKIICVIPAGERWEDGNIRFALEDYLGAGAILNELGGNLSPEAQAAVALFREYQQRIFPTIYAAISGREKRSKQLDKDVVLACECNVSSAVPLLNNGYYGKAAPATE